MNKRSLLLFAVIAGVITLFVAVGIYAGTAVPDSIKMQNKAYSEHTKGVVEFHHQKHGEEYAKKYPDFYKKGCGECHHDENHKPLASLKPGDEVKGCMECHDKVGYITGKKAKGLSAKLKREYHANAIHDNCRGCHRDYNKKNKLISKNPKAAPTTCKKCHPKG